MKLVIQIPAWNEEATLSDALASLPRSLPGFSEVVILVVDDGSTDRTAEVAREGFADRLVRFSKHRGLAAAFSAGLDASLEMGADVIVHFDAHLPRRPPARPGRHPEARRADPRRPGGHRGRRPGTGQARALFAGQASAPEAGELDGPAGDGVERPGRDLGPARVHPRGGAPDER